MSIINDVLGLFLGNKYEKDIKEINPFIDKIRLEFEKLGSLSNDQLRERSEAIRKEIYELDSSMFRTLMEFLSPHHREATRTAGNIVQSGLGVSSSTATTSATDCRTTNSISCRKRGSIT